MKARRLALAVLVTFARVAAADDLAAERARRNDELVAAGFNMTRGMTVPAAGARLELLVPPSDDEHDVALWFAAPSGEMSVRLVAPDGEVVASWKAARGEQRLHRRLATGRHVVEVAGAAGTGLVGVKGAVIGRCTVEGDRVREIAADGARGFHWPYLLVAPRSASAGTLLVLPNNTGFVSEDVELIRAAALCALGHELELADRLGTPVLVPLFPRPAAADDNLYLHALSRAALTARPPALARVDLQLIAMIDHARTLLPGLDKRVLMTGFSASGSFTARFAVLHPDRVLSAAAGSPGGWPIAPVAGAGMTYPVGIADAAQLTGKKIDLAALRRVRFFFFLGAEDRNDSLPYRDSFSAADEATVMSRFGKTPAERWDRARELYERAGLHATFKLYPGVAHQVSPAMAADVEAAFRAALAPR